MNRLVYISRLMNECDLMGDLLNEEEWTKTILNEIRREEDLVRHVYLKWLGGSKKLKLGGSEDVVEQWLDHVEQSRAFWHRWAWKCWWI
jgi:hypothetical protein